MQKKMFKKQDHITLNLDLITSQSLLKKKKLNLLLLPATQILLNLLFGYLLYAESWISHIALSMEKLDQDNLFIKRMLLQLLLQKSEKKMKVILITQLAHSEQTSTKTKSLEKKLEVSKEVQNLKINTIEYKKKKKEN